jgi:hypothetical protein
MERGWLRIWDEDIINSSAQEDSKSITEKDNIVKEWKKIKKIKNKDQIIFRNIRKKIKTSMSSLLRQRMYASCTPSVQQVNVFLESLYLAFCLWLSTLLVPFWAKSTHHSPLNASWFQCPIASEGCGPGSVVRGVWVPSSRNNSRKPGSFWRGAPLTHWSSSGGAREALGMCGSSCRW